LRQGDIVVSRLPGPFSASGLWLWAPGWRRE